MTIASPWQWFCSTRTFSNCLETTLTIAALYFWPWKLSSDTPLGAGSDPTQRDERPTGSKPIDRKVFSTSHSIKQYVFIIGYKISPLTSPAFVSRFFLQLQRVFFAQQTGLSGFLS
jgi:hypothetical protein